jgi:hypothetical protein
MSDNDKDTVNNGDVFEDIEAEASPESYSGMQEIGSAKLNVQIDPVADFSIGHDLHYGDNHTTSLRLGMNGEAFVRFADQADFITLQSSNLIDAGLLNQEIGDLSGNLSLHNSPLDDHRENEHFLGARTMHTYDHSNGSNTTLSHAAGINLDGELLLSSSIIHETTAGNWDISYGAQASYTGEDARLDLGASATRAFDLNCLEGKFNAAVQGTFGPETRCTAAAELDLHHEKSGLSAIFSAAVTHSTNTSAELSAGLYKDIKILGRAGVEATYDTEKQDTTVGIGLRAPF